MNDRYTYFGTQLKSDCITTLLKNMQFKSTWWHGIMHSTVLQPCCKQSNCYIQKNKPMIEMEIYKYINIISNGRNDISGECILSWKWQHVSLVFLEDVKGNYLTEWVSLPRVQQNRIRQNWHSPVVLWANPASRTTWMRRSTHKYTEYTFL